MKRPTARPALGMRQMYALMGVLVLILLPHSLRMPVWLDAALLLLFGWRAWLVHRQAAMPSRWLLLPVTVGLMAAVFFTYHTLLGRTGGVAVLSLLIGAKLLETRSRMDGLVLLYLGYFLVLTNFLFDQSIAFAVYLFIMVWLVTAVLVAWHSETAFRRLADLRAHLWQAGLMMAQAVPVMVLLFIFFPRIEGPLWRLPQDRAAAHAGLADSMSPGSFSNLSRNDDVAFRVAFVQGHPLHDQLYWRGPVFEEYDGTTWQQGVLDNAPAPVTVPVGRAQVQYETTLEAHQHTWLLALDMPVSLPADARLTDRLQAVAARPLERRLRVTLTSALAYRSAVQEQPIVLARNLLLPRTGNPQARAEAEKWRALPPEARIDAALRLFTRQKLNYTLEPPLYGANAVDDFVYVGKLGFCEHFAGAFVFMMRAAGVPARVVGGYQGGEQNGDYWIVRQADAHAWAEVWLAGRGWVRVDPTFTVAPARIEEGLASAAPQEELPYLLRLDNNLVKRMRLALDSVVNGWNQWVIGYTPERQRAVLHRLGIDDLASTTFIAWFVGSMGVLLGGLWAWVLWRARAPGADPAKRLWLGFAHKLAHAGFPALPGEGPLDHAQRAQAGLTHRAGEIAAIVELYLAVRYAEQPGLAVLKQRIRAFRP